MKTVMKTLVLPWPPKALSPNARGHWSKKHKAAQKYRSDCYYLAKGGATLKPSTQGIIDLTVFFYPPDKRRRDFDNMLASIKAGIDGVADAWNVDDYKFRFHLDRGDVRKHGAVEVRWKA